MIKSPMSKNKEQYDANYIQFLREQELARQRNLDENPITYSGEIITDSKKVAELYRKLGREVTYVEQDPDSEGNSLVQTLKEQEMARQQIETDNPLDFTEEVETDSEEVATLWAKLGRKVKLISNK